MTKAGRRLAERREQQGFFVPFGNGCVDALRNNDLTAKGLADRRVAADMVGM
jgi:hypothetical protein